MKNICVGANISLREEAALPTSTQRRLHPSTATLARLFLEQLLAVSLTCKALGALRWRQWQMGTDASNKNGRTMLSEVHCSSCLFSQMA